MQNATAIDPTWTVNEIMARYPATISVFNKFGLDTCCGSGAPLADAAHRDGADVDALLEALRKATSDTPAERDVALALLKGRSHKAIAHESGRSERTVRQHAVAVYQKSGLGGRTELSAFFLEGLMLPAERDELRPAR